MNLFENLLNRIATSAQIKSGQKGLDLLEAQSKDGLNITNNLLLQLVEDNKDTEYGKKYNFKDIKTIEDYKRLVPFSTYDDYEEYIQRMVKNNEKNLITAYPKREPVHYALSSGSVGVPKHIPVSQATIDIYSQYAASRLFANAENYYKKKYGKSYPRGKALNLIEIKFFNTENGVPKGAISGAMLYSKKDILKHVFTSPSEIVFPTEAMDMKYMKLRFALIEPDVTYMTSAFMTAIVDLMNYLRDNWELLCDDIEKGTIDSSILVSDTMRATLEAKLKPNKKRADELRAVFKQGFDSPFIQKIWPKLTFVGTIGTGGFASYTEKFREMAGDKVFIDFMTYAASESLMAVAVGSEEEDFVLLPTACYYEFIPLNADDEETTYGINELKVGEFYEIVITNLSGFYRYKIKDVVKVTGYYNELPRITFAFRKSQMVSIAGEKTNDISVKYAIDELSKELGSKVMDYTIYADTDCEPGRYVMCIEPESPLDIKMLPKCRDILEEKLGFANPSYGAKVKEGVLSPMVAHFSQIETHAAYRDLMIMKGISPNQLKPVRVLDTPRKEKFFLNMIEDESDL